MFTHTTRYAANLDIDSLEKRFSKLGIIPCITDHNTMAGCREIKKKDLSKLVMDCYRKVGLERTVKTLDYLKDIALNTPQKI
jgi:DNA-directed RNA polymerase beta' subunit